MPEPAPREVARGWRLTRAPGEWRLVVSNFCGRKVTEVVSAVCDEGWKFSGPANDWRRLFFFRAASSFAVAAIIGCAAGLFAAPPAHADEYWHELAPGPDGSRAYFLARGADVLRPSFFVRIIPIGKNCDAGEADVQAADSSESRVCVKPADQP